MTEDEFITACIATDPKDLDAVDRLIIAFESELPNHGCGGGLHNVLEDSNWEDDSIAWCIGNARTNQPDPTVVALGELLLRVPVDDRRRWFCNCGCMNTCNRCDPTGERPCVDFGIGYLRGDHEIWCAECAGMTYDAEQRPINTLHVSIGEVVDPNCIVEIDGKTLGISIGGMAPKATS